MKNVKPTIAEIKLTYFDKLDSFDLDILIAFVVKKEREFILAHPELTLTKKQKILIDKLVKRRIKKEPIAYLTGKREFYGLSFIVDKNTLIPRPETELLVDETLVLLRSMLRNKLRTKINIIDIGTGSGNIIISLAHCAEHGTWDVEQKENLNFFAIDISDEALKVAQKNAKINGVNKKIKFLHGSLLDPFLKHCKLNHCKFNENCKLKTCLPVGKVVNYEIIIIANLPYLSQSIYTASPNDVIKYEPKTALYSKKEGLAHYEKLINQILRLKINYPTLDISFFLEISPEQKKPLTIIIKKYFPTAQINFKKDLAQKTRICKINI